LDPQTFTLCKVHVPRYHGGFFTIPRQSDFYGTLRTLHNIENMMQYFITDPVDGPLMWDICDKNCKTGRIVFMDLIFLCTLGKPWSILRNMFG